jgi:hypothetical protein
MFFGRGEESFLARWEHPPLDQPRYPLCSDPQATLLSPLHTPRCRRHNISQIKLLLLIVLWWLSFVLYEGGPRIHLHCSSMVLTRLKYDSKMDIFMI